jgi:uncharacterized protein YggE
LKNKQYLTVAAILAITIVSLGAYIVNATENTVALADNTAIADIQKTLNVTGAGLALSEPDLAKVSLGVYTEAANADEAVKQNAVKMSNIIDALKVLGISNESMETRYYNLQPVTDYIAKPPRVVGYRASNVITVSIYELDTVGKVIDTAVKAGANEVQGIVFTLTNNEAQQLKLKALENASKDAQAKATTIAHSLGVNIQGVLKVTEGSSNYPIYLSGVKDMQNANTPIIPGDVQISATLQVTYLIQ